ncbi:MAG: GntR family transcriptional regulator [Brevinematia bacterium]
MERKMSSKVNTPKYELIKETLRDMVLNGEIKDKLPGERVLAKEFGVSYMTMRKAVEELTDEEFLYKEPGRGTFVCRKGYIYKKTYNIGFFLPEWIGGGITGHYYSTLFNQLEHFSHLNGYNLIYFSKVKDLFPYSPRRKADGIIFTLFPEEEEYIREIQSFVHIVTVETALEGSSIPAVLIDNFSGGYQATSHLIKLGHERIAYITGRLNNKLGLDRLSGYKKALSDANIKLREGYIIEGDFLFDTGFNLTEKVLSLSPVPTAVVTGNDLMALGLMKGLQIAGRNVPEDISLVGFDDIEAASQSHPALTTIHVYHDEVAKMAVEMLLRLIDNNFSEKQTVKCVPVTLIERESCRKI